MAAKAKGPRRSEKPGDEEDDVHTQISKQISWVLRRGAKGVGIDMDDHGYVAIADLKKYQPLADIDISTIMQVLTEKNSKKARYQLSPDYHKVRAYNKDERKNLNAQFYESTQETVAAAAASTPAAQAQHPGYNWGMYQQMMNPWMGAMMGYGWQQAAAAQAQMSNRHTGRIKSFNAEKGFGFIECEATYATYQRDVFLHRAQIGDMEPGQFVTFVCELNKQNMPQAKELAAYGSAPPKDAFGGKGKGKGKGKSKDQKGDAKGKGKDKKKEKKEKDDEPKEENTADGKKDGQKDKEEKKEEK